MVEVAIPLPKAKLLPITYKSPVTVKSPSAKALTLKIPVVTVPVAIKFPTLKVPEMRASPWTAKSAPGVVVPTPKRSLVPHKLKKVDEALEPVAQRP